MMTARKRTSSSIWASSHQKGTKGFTEDYLARLHKTLHQRSRDPLPEHTHPGDEDQDPDSDSAGEFAGV